MPETAEYPDTLFPRMLEERVRDDPNGLFAQVLEDDWRTMGPRDVTNSTMLRAVDRASHWLDHELGGKAKDFDSFVYLGEADLRYGILTLAATKTQRQIVVVDGRLVDSAMESILRETKCKFWITSEGKISSVPKFVKESPEISVHIVPAIESLWEEGKYEPYPYTKTWKEAVHDPVWVVHTSGTTGLPKVVGWSNATMGCMNICPMLPSGERENQDLVQRHMMDSHFLWIPPPQWAAGLIAMCIYPLAWGGVPIFPPASAPTPVPSELVREIVHAFDLQGGYYIPATLRDLCLDPATVERLRKQSVIYFAGAPLDDWVGDLLQQHTRIVSFIGAIEAAWFVTTDLPRENWKYFRSSDKAGYYMDPVGDDMYELVFEKRLECKRYQGIFSRCPELNTYRTKDLFTKHPEKGDDYYRYAGRADDLFKLNFLAKVNAKNIETALETHKLISGGMVGGEARPSPFVIVEVAERENKSEEELKDLLWGILKEVNSKNITEIEIPRANIILADSDRPLVKTLKGTLNRTVIAKSYEEEIENLYAETENGNL